MAPHIPGLDVLQSQILVNLSFERWIFIGRRPTKILWIIFLSIERPLIYIAPHKPDRLPCSFLFTIKCIHRWTDNPSREFVPLIKSSCGLCATSAVVRPCSAVRSIAIVSLGVTCNCTNYALRTYATYRKHMWWCEVRERNGKHGE